MVLIPHSRDKWLLSKFLLDNFFDIEPVSSPPLTEMADEDDNVMLPSPNYYIRLFSLMTVKGMEL